MERFKSFIKGQAAEGIVIGIDIGAHSCGFCINVPSTKALKYKLPFQGVKCSARYRTCVTLCSDGNFSLLGERPTELTAGQHYIDDIKSQLIDTDLDSGSIINIKDVREHNVNAVEALSTIITLLKGKALCELAGGNINHLVAEPTDDATNKGRKHVSLEESIYWVFAFGETLSETLHQILTQSCEQAGINKQCVISEARAAAVFCEQVVLQRDIIPREKLYMIVDLGAGPPNISVHNSNTDWYSNISFEGLQAIKQILERIKYLVGRLRKDEPASDTVPTHNLSANYCKKPKHMQRANTNRKDASSILSQPQKTSGRHCQQNKTDPLGTTSRQSNISVKMGIATTTVGCMDRQFMHSSQPQSQCSPNEDVTFEDIFGKTLPLANMNSYFCPDDISNKVLKLRELVTKHVEKMAEQKKKGMRAPFCNFTFSREIDEGKILHTSKELQRLVTEHVESITGCNDVNQQFCDYMKTLVEPDTWESFQIRFVLEYIETVDKFGQQLNTFAKDERICIPVPSALLCLTPGLNEAIAKRTDRHKDDSTYNKAEHRLYIHPSITETFLQRYVGHIISIIGATIANCSDTIACLVVVGGNANSPYIQNKLKTNFGGHIQVLLPIEPSKTVQRGAAMHLPLKIPIH